MTRNVRFIVLDGDGKPMEIYYQVEDVKYEEYFDYCAADWANRIIKLEDSSAEAKLMAMSLLNYGGCAQKYLGDYNPENPANPNGYMAEEMEQIEADPQFDMVLSDNAYDLGFERAKLALEADTTIRIYFNKAVKVTVDGKEVKVYKDKNSDIWLAMIEGISSRNISRMYKIEFSPEGSEETATVDYSVLSWANKQMADGNENSIPTAKALYLYNKSALVYLGPVKP